MRKIERLMNQAITDGRDWSLDNTSVRYDKDANESRVYLHGNHIATVGNDFVQLFDGGWQTVTTKSRLNAICSAHAVDGEGVFQKQHAWYVRTCDTKTDTFTTKEFTNGFMLI